MNSYTGAKVGTKGATQRGPTPKARATAKQEPLGKANDFVVFGRVIDQKTRRPIAGAKYTVLDAQGAVKASGQTDWGGTVRHELPEAGTYTVRIIALPRS